MARRMDSLILLGQEIFVIRYFLKKIEKKAKTNHVKQTDYFGNSRSPEAEYGSAPSVAAKWVDRHIRRS
jgi:hypothetical protein